MPSHTTEVPHSYTTPSWPSLYWPIKPGPGVSKYLYYTSDIWRFTLYWTLFFFAAVHICASVWAVLMQLRASWGRRHKFPTAMNETITWVWAVPVIYCVIGGIEALFAGSIVGLVLGAVYSAGYYKMSTWIPFLWGLINVLVLILSSFSIQGGL